MAKRGSFCGSVTEAGMDDALPHPIAPARLMLDKIWSFQVVWTSSKATAWKIRSPVGCGLSPDGLVATA